MGILFMTVRASNKYYIMERLCSEYDHTDTYIAEDPVSGQAIRIRYDPFDGNTGSIILEDVTEQLHKIMGGKGQSEKYHLDYEPNEIADSVGTPGVEYPVFNPDMETDVGFLYIRVYYSDKKMYRANDTSYNGTVEFFEEIISPKEEDEKMDEIL
jgi:hypothetical protein